jgi:hypothetical protein
MIVHLKYNVCSTSNVKAIEVTFDDANSHITEQVNLKGHNAFQTNNVDKKESYFEFFYDTDNPDIDKWDIIPSVKEFVTMLVYLTKPYIREHNLNKLIK